MNLKADSSPTVVPPDQKVSVTKEMSWENGSLDRLGRKSKRRANNTTVLTLNFEVLTVPSILVMTKVDLRHVCFALPCINIVKNRHGDVILGI